jgi:hypothetical protein
MVLLPLRTLLVKLSVPRLRPLSSQTMPALPPRSSRKAYESFCPTPPRDISSSFAHTTPKATLPFNQPYSRCWFSKQAQRSSSPGDEGY